MVIYLDNAATTPLSTEVLEAMLPYMKGHYGNPSSIHMIGRTARTAVERARRNIADCLNASVGEIFFTSGGTEGNNLALIRAVKDLGVKHILTSPLEHHCVLHTLEMLEKEHGIEKYFVSLDEKGQIVLASLEKFLQELQQKDGKVLVTLMHGNNEIGNLLDLDAVSIMCQNYNALFHTDTVQTFGFYPIDVQKTKIHFLTGSGHKLHGPKGTGFIYINSEQSIQPNMLGGSQERNMRAGTENVGGIVGLAKAATIAHENMSENEACISGLKHYLMEQLQTHIPDVRFNGDPLGSSTCKVLNVAFPANKQSSLLLINLDISGVCASGGSACSSGVDVGSHVLNALQVDTDTVNIRFSFSKYNTKAELDILMEKLSAILKINTFNTKTV